MFILPLHVILFVILFNSQRIYAGYIETLNVRGSETDTFLLTCRHLSSVIAILAADFTSTIINDTSFNSSIVIAPTAFPRIHPRQALNKRCSGLNHCNFILIEDCPGADQWGPGTLTITYACVSEDRIEKYCNREIVLPPAWFEEGSAGDSGEGVQRQRQRQISASSDGFIHNPGYPRLYSGHRKCRWKIRAPPQQRIRLTILDIAMTADSYIDPSECTDRLDIIESNQIIYATCSSEEPPVKIVSNGDTLEIVLSSQQPLNPRRGVLLRYTAVGCPTPGPPLDGYLVHRNDTHALYTCCLGYVFADTGLRKRTLHCLDGHWMPQVPLEDCQKTVVATSEVKRYEKHLEMDTELIPPIIIIIALFGLNCAALLFIYKKRQSQVTQFTDEELNALQ